jgi:hypothetical protein
MREIALWLIERIVALIPAFLLRLLYPPVSVAKDIHIELRGEMPIYPSLGSSVPHLDVCLELTNLSNLTVILDRMLLDLWFGQPTVNGTILKRTSVRPRSKSDSIYFRCDLTQAQIHQIKPYTEPNPPSGSITLSVLAYFETKVGLIEVTRKLERRRV